MEELHNLTNIKSDKKLLDKEYNNSLKDEYFNKIVTKLKLDKEYLEKSLEILENTTWEDISNYIKMRKSGEIK